MSGHSKWHNIQKTKGAQDAKRAAAFTKIAKELIVAVKEGGSADPAYNSRLATVVTKAKAANMPNDNIKRCLEKAAGAGGDNYESITYEGYGPGGVAVIVETMTDNRNRTAGSMLHHFNIADLKAFESNGKGVLLTSGTRSTVAWELGGDELKKIDMNPKKPGTPHSTRTHSAHTRHLGKLPSRPRSCTSSRRAAYTSPRLCSRAQHRRHSHKLLRAHKPPQNISSYP